MSYSSNPFAWACRRVKTPSTIAIAHSQPEDTSRECVDACINVDAVVAELVMPINTPQPIGASDNIFSALSSFPRPWPAGIGSLEIVCFDGIPYVVLTGQEAFRNA